MKTPAPAILEYRSPPAPADSRDDENEYAREVFGWLFVTLVLPPAGIGLVVWVGKMLQ